MSAPGDSPPPGSPVGTLLRAARQRSGLSIQDVAASLRIRAPYIEAIEDGRTAELPAPAYAVGFVKAYAKALGLDEAEILRRFRQEAEGLGGRTRLEFPSPVPDRGVPAGAVALLGIVLAAGAYAGWWYGSGAGVRPQEAVAPLPERLAVAEAPRTAAAPPPIVAPPFVAPPVDPRFASPLAGLPAIAPGPFEQPAVIPPVQSPPPPVASLAPPVSTPVASGSPASAQAAVPPPGGLAPAAPLSQGATLPEGVYGAANNEESRVLVRARAETWIQVRDRASGTVVFNRTLRAGESYRVPMRAGLLLTMGNAPGTDLLVDGQVVANPFPATSVRRDIPLEPERVREAMAQAPAVPRAPGTPAAPGGPAPAAASPGAGGWTWGTGGTASN